MLRGYQLSCALNPRTKSLAALKPGMADLERIVSALIVRDLRGEWGEA